MVAIKKSLGFGAELKNHALAVDYEIDGPDPSGAAQTPDHSVGRRAGTRCEQTFPRLALPNAKKFEGMSTDVLVSPEAVVNRPSLRRDTIGGALLRRHAIRQVSQCAPGDSIHIYGGHHNSLAGQVRLGSRLSCELGDAPVDRSQKFGKLRVGLSRRGPAEERGPDNNGVGGDASSEGT
jgi:hypothetical protein